MPKAILEFHLPEEENEFQAAIQGQDCRMALWDIAQEIFRPARKHGYSDQRIQELIDKNEKAVELIGLLETRFYVMLEERGINIHG